MSIGNMGFLYDPYGNVGIPITKQA